MSESTNQFRVACVQNCAGNDLDENLRRIEKLIGDAHAAGAELICLPEFYCQLEPDDGDYFKNGFDESSHPAVTQASSLARSLKIWLALGSVPVRTTDNKVHNRSLMVSPEGEIVARYNKIHLFDVAIKDGQAYRESVSVSPGDAACIAELPWGRLGLSICYDVRFAQLYRHLAHNGADFIAIPAAFTAKTGAAHWHTLVRARAIENGCYVFAAGQCGQRSWGRRTYGHSLIVDPWGEVLADAGEDEGFVIANIQPERVAEVRTMIPSLSHDRPYTPLTPLP